MRTVYQEAIFQEVLDYWAKQYRFQSHEKLESYKAYVDVNAGVVVFRLIIEEATDPKRPLDFELPDSHSS